MCDCVCNPAIEVVIFHLRGWCMLDVFLLLAFTYLGHECQDLGSSESVRWNACVHRLDLDLYSHAKFLGNGVRTSVNSKGKIHSTRGSEEDRTGNAVSGRTANPAHYVLSYSGPPLFPVKFVCTERHSQLN